MVHWLALEGGGKDDKSRFVVSVRLWQASAEEKLFDILTLSGAPT